MAKLVRKTQKIFASGSAQNQVTSFGSIKAGAVDYTKDVADIQTEAFEGGWSSAIQDDYAPYRQDRNAVDFVTTSQLAYVFQEGLPEYDANTTYYRGSWVKGNDGDAFSIYESLSDDNTGNALSDEEKWEKKSFGGGLEIGDIGFAPLGIDETQNKRRYLNGQVISQAQFVSFTKKIKEAIQLNPSLATSETNWQAEVTNSPYGICGKFVIDDAMGTIRLPKYPNWHSRNIAEIPVIGNGITLGLTNGTQNTGLITGTDTNNLASTTGNYGQDVGIAVSGATSTRNKSLGVTTDPEKSGIIADLTQVTEESKVSGHWFIQVATGVEESVDVTREIELNNPFSLLDYKWSEYELNNASWLLSNGAFHSGATYVAVYELLLKLYSGAETKEGVSVKLSTEEYTDTDFVINTTDTTFRLPIKVKLASGNAVVGDGTALGLINQLNVGGKNYYLANNSALQLGFNTANGYTVPAGVTTDPTKSGIVLADNDMYLYFYVGETIQDANVINASGILTRMAELTDGYISSLGALDMSQTSVTFNVGSNFELPTDGYVFMNSTAGTTNTGRYWYLSVNGTRIDTRLLYGSSAQASLVSPLLKKGQIVNISTTTGTSGSCYFKPVIA